MPTNHAAVVTGAGQPLSIIEAPYPKPSRDEILVSVSAIALNPADWKLAQMDISSHPIFNLKYPFVTGEDIAGTVVDVGEGVTSVSSGDRVIAQSNGAIPQINQRGGFQKFVIVPKPYFGKITDGTPFEKAVVLPLGMMTAARGLFDKARFGMALPPSFEGRGKTLLVWGGSSSVGVDATQLSAASGYEVLAVASRHNFDLCKSVGASLVFDYNDITFVEEIASAMKGKDMVGCYDAIGSADTCKLICEIIERSETTKRITSVSPFIPDSWVPEGFQVTCFRPTSEEWSSETGIVSHLFDWIGNAVEKGVMKTKPEP